jgi:sulfate permease, SulP family
VTAITMLLNTTGIELATRREAEFGRELKTLGVANAVAGLIGGYVSCISLSRTTLVYAAGGRSPICGLTVAAASVLMLAVDPSFVAYIPKFGGSRCSNTPRCSPSRCSSSNSASLPACSSE